MITGRFAFIATVYAVLPSNSSRNQPFPWELIQMTDTSSSSAIPVISKVGFPAPYDCPDTDALCGKTAADCFNLSLCLLDSLLDLCFSLTLRNDMEKDNLSYSLCPAEKVYRTSENREKSIGQRTRKSNPRAEHFIGLYFHILDNFMAHDQHICSAAAEDRH